MEKRRNLMRLVAKKKTRLLITDHEQPPRDGQSCDNDDTRWLYRKGHGSRRQPGSRIPCTIRTENLIRRNYIRQMRGNWYFEEHSLRDGSTATALKHAFRVGPRSISSERRDKLPLEQRRISSTETICQVELSLESYHISSQGISRGEIVSRVHIPREQIPYRYL